MSKMIQLRHVPDELHRKLKLRAMAEGKSLSDYLIAEVAKIAERPSPAELRDRIAKRTSVSVKTKPAAAVRAGRENF